MVKLKKTYYIIFSIALVLLIGIIILVVCLTIPQNASENVTSEQTHLPQIPIQVKKAHHRMSIATILLL